MFVGENFLKRTVIICSEGRLQSNGFRKSPKKDSSNSEMTVLPVRNRDFQEQGLTQERAASGVQRTG